MNRYNLSLSGKHTDCGFRVNFLLNGNDGFGGRIFSYKTILCMSAHFITTIDIQKKNNTLKQHVALFPVVKKVLPNQTLNRSSFYPIFAIYKNWL
jgi:hypothetical protein